MALTVSEVLGSHPEALLNAAQSVASSIAEVDSHIGNERSSISALAAGWSGGASTAAQANAATMIAAQERQLDQLRSLHTAMASGGLQLTGLRAALQAAITGAEATGWKVGDTGAVTAGPLWQWVSRISPVAGMQVDIIRTQMSAAVQTMLAQFKSADLNTGEAIRRNGGKSDEQPKADEPPPGTPEPDPAPTSTTGNNPADIARQFLGRNASDLKRSGELPMDPSVPDDVCCANFVTATLQKAGLIDWHSNGVSDMAGRLQAQGWHIVPAAQARPGDVAVIGGGDHTELVADNNNGAVSLIGSNNVNSDGTQRISMGNPYGNIYYLSPP